MDTLLREGFYMSAPCGGTGRCGKCRIQVLAGQATVSHEDLRCFTKEELEQGWRLSCTLYPSEDMTISFDFNDESEFDVISAYEGVTLNQESDQEQGTYAIAIDIGTTTLAFQLLNLENKNICGTVTAINNQRKYGADVVSRIQAAIDGRQKELQDCVRKDLQKGIQKLLEDCRVKLSQVIRIGIGCNTTMGHLLLGYACDGLGVFPFTPVNIQLVKGCMQEILDMEGDAEVTVLPGISTYVGGDIVAGLYSCEFQKTDEICLLVDLGTNGEMALGNGRKILVTSTAAGPAFEGGNISCGMGSVAGAICGVKLEHTKAKVSTIYEKAPIGICGTGVVETVAELVREGLLDETGLLDEDYFEEGFPLAHTLDGKTIVLTQKDIRELQLAKAAIRAGIETLLLRYGVGKDEVAKVYLAGGFGYRLDTIKAIAIGMLPEEFAGKIYAVGNSCLAGVVNYLKTVQNVNDLQELVEMSEEIHLSTDKDFNDAYIEAMMFDTVCE